EEDLSSEDPNSNAVTGSDATVPTGEKMLTTNIQVPIDAGTDDAPVDSQHEDKTTDVTLRRGMRKESLVGKQGQPQNATPKKKPEKQSKKQDRRMGTKARKNRLVSLSEVSRDDRHKLARYILNDSCEPQDGFGRVLILVGASGSGKSTMANGLVNFLMGVEWDHDRRYEIDMTSAVSGEESHASQTKWVTGYTIKSPEYGIMTIVDTPGFADTGGMDTDAFIPKQIRAFFKVNGMKELCGVGIVVPAAQSRLTPAEKYVYHSCLKMFGKDVTDNFYVIFTFADCSDPPALEAIKAENIPHRDYFQVNNSAIYCANKPEENTGFAKLYWDMGVRGFGKLCTSLSTIKPVSLALTSEVMAEQDALEDKIAELKRQLETNFEKFVNLKKQETEVPSNHSRSNVQNLKVSGKLGEVRDKLMGILKDLNDSLLRLSERSMKSSAMTVMDYIQLLIDAELQERRPGFREKLQVLEEAKKLAEIMCGTHEPNVQCPVSSNEFSKFPRLDHPRKGAGSLMFQDGVNEVEPGPSFPEDGSQQNENVKKTWFGSVGRKGLKNKAGLRRQGYHSTPGNRGSKPVQSTFKSHLDTDDKGGSVHPTSYRIVQDPDHQGPKTPESKRGLVKAFRNSIKRKKKRDEVHPSETHKSPGIDPVQRRPDPNRQGDGGHRNHRKKDPCVIL
ncbi:unnamed protein product, partial [Darwinula stevensoni]